MNKVEPRIVDYEKDGVTPNTINYNEIGPILAGAIQQLKKIIDGIVGDVAEIKDHLTNQVDPEIAALQASNDELKAANDNLRADISASKAANDNEAAQIQALTARLDALEAGSR